MSRYFIILFLLQQLQATGQKPRDGRTYSFRYEEEVRSAYSNLLEKRDSADFKKYSNSWAGSVTVFQNMENEILQFRLYKDQNEKIPASASPDSAGIFFDVRLIRSADDVVSSVCYSSYPGREVDMLVRNLLASIQSFGEVKTSRQIENFPDGQFISHYRTGNGSGKSDAALILIKDKEALRKPGASTSVIIDSFACVLHYQQDHFLNSAHLLEFKHQKLGRETLAYIRTEFQIIRVATLRAEGRHPGFQDTTCLSVYSVLSRTERKQLISRSSLKNTQPDALLAELNANESLSSSRQFELVSKLKALLYLQPEFFSSLQAVLDTLQPVSPSYPIIFNALLGSESIPPQQYLARFLRNNENNYEVLRSLLPQIGIMTYVIDTMLLNELSALLFSTNEDISSLAGLSLSNLCQQYKYTDTTRYRMVADLLYDHYLKSDRSDADLVSYLKQVGNAGDESKTGLIATSLEEKKSSVPEEAFYACRFIFTPAMDSILAKQIILRLNDSTASENVYNVVRLRFPARLIRQSIYYLLHQRDQGKTSLQLKYLNYLRTYADEIPTLQKEVAGIHLNNTETAGLLKEIKQKRKWFCPE